MTTDLLIIGGGPAGYEAALEAARRGVKTALVEKEHLGGTCLNWGCIPTKLFLGAVSAMAELEGQKKMKVAAGEIAVDLPALVDRKARHLEATRKVMAQELEKAGVELVRGELKMMGASQVVYTQNDEPKTLKFSKCMLATGSRPAAYPGLKADHEVFLNSGDILGLRTVPESLAVVGCGAIGLEMGPVLFQAGDQDHPARSQGPHRPRRGRRGFQGAGPGLQAPGVDHSRRGQDFRPVQRRRARAPAPGGRVRSGDGKGPAGPWGATPTP